MKYVENNNCFNNHAEENADDTNCADIPQQKGDDEHNRFQQNHLVNISHEVITF